MKRKDFRWHSIIIGSLVVLSFILFPGSGTAFDGLLVERERYEHASDETTNPRGNNGLLDLEKQTFDLLEKHSTDDSVQVKNVYANLLFAAEQELQIRAQSSEPIIYYEVEPNDNIDQANLVDGNYSGQPYYLFGTITDYNLDLDYYRFDLTIPGTFDILGIWVGDYYGFGWEDDLAFCLLDANANILAWSQLWGTGSSTYQHLVMSVPPGTYYIVVMQTLDYSYLYVNQWYGLSVEFEADELQPVYIPDSNLEQAIRDELNKPLDPITELDIQQITFLDAAQRGIEDLTGLETATNLMSLSIWENQISDLTPLTNLTDLEFLNFNANQVSDLSPLSGLYMLEWLSFEGNQINDLNPLENLENMRMLSFSDNQISDIGLLAGFTALEYLYFNFNEVSDISPLENLVNLLVLEMRENYLDITEGSDTMVLIQQLIDSGVDVVYIPQREVPVLDVFLTIELEGQGITEPSTGTHEYSHGSEIFLSAIPASGWQFSKWKVNGTEYNTPEITTTMDSDQTAVAVFQPTGTGSITHVVLEIEGEMVVFTIGAYGSALAAGPGNETYDYMAAGGVPMVRAVGSGDKYIGIGAYGTAFAQEGNTAGAIAAAPAQSWETTSDYLVFDGFDGDGQPILTPLFP